MWRISALMGGSSRPCRGGHFLCAAVALLGVCALSVTLAAQTTVASAGLATATPTPANTQQSSPDLTLRDGLYVFQRGDEISIKVFEHPELDDTVRIRPDGKISALLLDDVVAAGLTTQELHRELTARYREFYKEPKVSVIVRSFAEQKVYVGGEVGHPGTIPLAGDLTALGAVLQAGGFKDTAKTDNVILLRNNGHQAAKAEKLNLRDVVAGTKGDILLQPFDVVYVPRSKIARVDKFIDQYFRQLTPIPLTGGFTYILGSRVVLF